MNEEEEEAFFNFEEESQKLENNNSDKKTKIKLSFYQLRELKAKEIGGKKLKQKEIAELTGYTDRMVRY